MADPKIHFTASAKPEARQALEAMTRRYGQTAASKADATEIVKVKKVFQGDAAAALQQVGAGTTVIADAVAIAVDQLHGVDETGRYQVVVPSVTSS